jgi:hypothetical protein
MAYDISKITAEVNNLVGVLDTLRWVIGGFCALSITFFIGFVTFFTNWINRISDNQDARIDGTYELIETDVAKIESNFEEAKTDLYSKVNSALQVLSAIHENLENLEKKIDRIQRICDATHRKGIKEE